jgi:hypothetical protein
MSSVKSTTSRITPGNLIAAALCLALPLLCACGGIFRPLWATYMAESDEVFGAVAVASGKEVLIVVSGYSKTSSNAKGGRVSSTPYPRLTSYRASDGERVATRLFAPMYFRWSYVDEDLFALAPGQGQVWVASTDEASLQRVDPRSLKTGLSWANLAARQPLLQSGLYHDGGSESPVRMADGDLIFRLKSGEWVSLDPSTASARALRGGEEAWDDAPRDGQMEGIKALRDSVKERSGALDPRVVPVTDLAGKLDNKTGLVISQRSLDRDSSPIDVARWDMKGGRVRGGGEQVWSTGLEELRPSCCRNHAWRTGGLFIVWMDEWLFALDEDKGQLRWLRRI